MIVKVQQKHIDEGNPGVCDSCALALAIKDMGYTNASVDHGEIKIKKDSWSNFKVFETRVHNKWIEKFDEDKDSVKPRSFNIGKGVCEGGA